MCRELVCSDILKLIDIIKNKADCHINNPCGQPLLREGEVLPDDLKLFYEKCGGVIFNNNKFHFEIVNPMDMVLINPILVGEICEEDISSEWYVIGKDIDNNYISIDLGKERLGRCYDSFFDRHGVVGECSIVARSFTELLWNLMYNQGEDFPFWLGKNFNYIGDAYEGFAEEKFEQEKMISLNDVNNIISDFVSASINNGIAQEDGNANQANKHYRVIEKRREWLVEHNELCNDRFLKLLNHENDYVRLHASCALLNLKNKDALATLSDLAEKKGVLGFSAKMTISEYKKGHIAGFAEKTIEQENLMISLGEENNK